MKDLDLNYLYWMTDQVLKGLNDKDSNQMAFWLESLKEHITYLDMINRNDESLQEIIA